MGDGCKKTLKASLGDIINGLVVPLLTNAGEHVRVRYQAAFVLSIYSDVFQVGAY
jgi:hypothetical protein